MAEFNLNDILTQIKTQQGNKPYVNFRNAVLWFHKDHPLPEGRINTVQTSIEPTIFRAEVWIGDVCVATAHAGAEGNTTTLRKIESAAVRRALANAGYDADHAIHQLAQSIGADAAKEKLGSGGSRSLTGKESAQGNWASPATIKQMADNAFRELGVIQSDLGRYAGVENIEDMDAWNAKYPNRKAAAQAIMVARREEDAVEEAEPV